MRKVDDQAKIEELAQRISVLVQFATALIPDIELIEKAATEAGNKNSLTATLATVLTAAGEDWEDRQLEASLTYQRAIGLYKFVETLKKTEEEKAKAVKSAEAKRKARADLARILGS